MRLVALIAVVATGCAELGVVGDGTTVSALRPSNGHLVDGLRIPDRGDGFFVRETWRARGNRWGTEELVDLIAGVSRRMAQRGIRERVIVADLSAPGGGKALQWHVSHQTGRDVDLLYYVRDARGQPVEPTAMVYFDDAGVAKDGSGDIVDVPRTWLIVRELLLAPEAVVQWIFLYEPLTLRVLAHAAKIGEPEALIARARRALKQPGKAAPHQDHIHVRIYCPPNDLAHGCADHGPFDLLEARQAEVAAAGGPIAHALGRADLSAIGRMVRGRGDRIALRRWR